MEVTGTQVVVAGHTVNSARKVARLIVNGRPRESVSERNRERIIGVISCMVLHSKHLNRNNNYLIQFEISLKKGIISTKIINSKSTTETAGQMTRRAGKVVNKMPVV